MFENSKCLYEYGQAIEAEINGESNLFKCKAKVIYTDRYMLLKSYNTIVAVYNSRTKTLYDVLRFTYGYTATSVQHIAKFKKYLIEHGFRVENFYRYYNYK